MALTKTEKEIRAYIKTQTKRQRAYLWGDYCVFTPVVLSEIFGDGKQVIYIGSIDQRPKFWIARIDSKQSIEPLEFDVEQIICAIEDEFGRVPESGYLTFEQFKEAKKSNSFGFDEYQNYREYKEDCEYPRMDWGGGHWGTLKNFGVK
jgi:hypothetical protein